MGNGSRQEHYWEDGPDLSGWGEEIGTYPDGKSAITEGKCGYGWVVLCGVHPEAPESWRTGREFTTSARVDNDFGIRLIQAALHARPKKFATALGTGQAYESLRRRDARRPPDVTCGTRPLTTEPAAAY